jgi:hypothetical protein
MGPEAGRPEGHNDTRAQDLGPGSAGSIDRGVAPLGLTHTRPEDR